MLFSFVAIYLVKSTSPSSSKTPTQHDAATTVLHSSKAVLRLGSSPPFPSNVAIVIMAKNLNVCIIRPQDMSPEMKIFVPECICKQYFVCCLRIRITSMFYFLPVTWKRVIILV
ncbi:hypothetical protein XENOCAPTIV_003571 [Xenoophorus captivus]|uniref:Uncharacterized protein n=1 Tax=Xenoophorus captivus TaxID=1517983 RepID=A0ABV0Q7U8_9TELE